MNKMSFTQIFGSVIVIGVFIYTVSFGNWTWKKKNKIGACMIYLLAAISVALPFYAVFIKA